MRTWEAGYNMVCPLISVSTRNILWQLLGSFLSIWYAGNTSSSSVRVSIEVMWLSQWPVKLHSMPIGINTTAREELLINTSRRPVQSRLARQDHEKSWILSEGAELEDYGLQIHHLKQNFGINATVSVSNVSLWPVTLLTLLSLILSEQGIQFIIYRTITIYTPRLHKPAAPH